MAQHARHKGGAHSVGRRWTRGRFARAAAVAVGVVVAGTGAYAATNWVVGLDSNSSGEGQSAAIANLTITAVASPVATNLMYPGSNGDVVATITNPNPYPVTVTGVDLPTNATYASGFTTSALSTAQTGCSNTTSDVIWNWSGATNSPHTFTNALVVAASGSLTVTFTNDASMTSAAPAACANTYFQMPSLTGVIATAGGGTATSSPTTDAWTS
jgi:hypothetical protein